MAAEQGDLTQTPSTCESAGPRLVAIAEQKPIPDDLRIDVEVEIGRERVSTEGPAKLDLTFTNADERRETPLREGFKCDLFDRDDGRSDPKGVWLYQDAETPEDRADGCWTREASPERAPGFDGYGCSPTAIETDESLSFTYEVWADYTTEGYLPPDTYRFSTSIELWPAGEDADDPE